MEHSFISNSYANRAGYGTHRAIECYEKYRNQHRHVLGADVYRYFPSIDHCILKADFRRIIACEPTLALMDAIVDGSNPQQPVELYFPGDDLFTPSQRHRGLPIGNLNSQWFANWYLNGFDHFVTEVLRAPYVRYVDDFAQIVPTSQDAPFLGLVLCNNQLRRLPEDNIRRFRNRLRGMRDQRKSGSIPNEEVVQRVSSWIAHADHASTWRLRHAIVRGGWFDPLWEPGSSPVGSA